jgi:hypothetical protein
VTLLLLFVAACGGPQIPTHNGYKTGDKAKPWKKAKTLKWDEKHEAKAEGELSYPDFRRAAWYVADLPQHGELDVRLEITPGENVGDEFDLPYEVLDPGNRVIAEDADAGNLTKQKSLIDLDAGKYLIHIYLNGRTDTADYVLKTAFKPSAATEGKSDFPAQVAFLPALPMVPINDDTPKNYKPPTTAVVVHTTHHTPTPPPTPKAPAAEAKPARIIGVSVVGGATQITIGLGTAKGAAAGMKGTINGVSGSSFTLASCNDRTCTATVSATPDQVNHSSGVVLTP